MYILIGDTKIKWQEEDTKKLQVQSLKNFAFALGYEPVTEKLSQGFKVNSGFASYYRKTNFISFDDMCRLHDFVNEDMYRNGSKKDYHPYGLVERLKLSSSDIFIKSDYLLSRLINDVYPVKLVEQLKLQRKKDEVDGVKVSSNLVKVTNIGQTYLEQNYYVFRKNQIIVE